MRKLSVVLAVSVFLPTFGTASEFDTFGAAGPAFVAIEHGPDIIFEVGVSAGFSPAYPGATTYEPSVSPILGIERFHIPGLVSLGGGEDQGGLSFGPSFDIVSARKSADHEVLNGLNDVGATYSAGVRVGYEIVLSDAISLEPFGQLRYGFGAASGLLGEIGADLTAELTPELEITAGSTISFASDAYMDAYFGISPAEAAATGGRLAAYDPSAGIQSANLTLEARYEFIPDTFLNAKASYTRFIGTAADSPIVQSGSANAFAVSLGISRQFSIRY